MSEMTWHYLGSTANMAGAISAAMQNAANGLSNMLGQPIQTGTCRSKRLRLREVTAQLGDPESAMVGIYLLLKGGLSGQSLMILPLPTALRWADRLMRRPLGTSAALGSLERSALAEVGNLTVSYFSNSMTALTGASLRPSPPAVMVDMIGAILAVLAVSVGAGGDELFVVETALKNAQGQDEGQFWVLPDLGSTIH